MLEVFGASVDLKDVAKGNIRASLLLQFQFFVVITLEPSLRH